MNKILNNCEIRLTEVFIGSIFAIKSVMKYHQNKLLAKFKIMCVSLAAFNRPILSNQSVDFYEIKSIVTKRPPFILWKKSPNR